MGLSNDELLARCRQLDIDCDVAISAAEGAKKELEDISKKTWQNIVTIISKNLKKDQTPDQAYDELIATGHLSKEVLQNIATGSAGLDVIEKIECWFGNVVGWGVGGGSLVACIGIGAYVKYVATPGFKAAQAATLAANEALAAFQAEGRAAFIARILGPNAAAQGAQRQIMLTNTALAAARQEALIDVQIANAGKWSSRLGRLGLWAGVAALGVTITAAIYKGFSEYNTTEELKHSLREMCTSRFYMTVQQKYLEFLVHHVNQIELYTTFLVKGDANGAATVLETMTSHAVEIDPETKKVKPESIKPNLWSETAVKAYLVKHDKDKEQKTDDDPDEEEMAKIHEEQLKKIQEKMNRELEEAKAQAAAAKQN